MNKKYIFNCLKFFSGSIFLSILCYLSAISLYFLDVEAVFSVVFCVLCFVFCFAFGYKFVKYVNKIFNDKMYFFVTGIIFAGFYVLFLINLKSYNFFIQNYFFMMIFFVAISAVFAVKQKRDNKWCFVICFIAVILTWL